MHVIRRALTRAERLAVTEVAQAANRPEAPLATFQAQRLAHPRRASATWWLLEEDGRAVSSLVVHPLAIAAGGTTHAAYGLGAVATRPEARRRGHADRLCRHAIAEAEAEGRAVGLLYSAVAPAYYERMGFHVLSAWQHVCAKPSELGASGPRATLTPLDPRREAGELARLYERHHGSAPHVFRDEGALLRNIALQPTDVFLGVGEPLTGYARLCLDPPGVEVTELIVPEAQRAPTLRALAHLTAALGQDRLVGWFPPCAELAAHFVDEGRAKTLPMLRGLAPDPHAHFWSTDYF